MNEKIYKANNKKTYVLVTLIILLSASIMTLPADATSGPLSWESKGSYVNYTVNSNIHVWRSNNYSRTGNSSGFASWNITSVKNGNYSFTLVDMSNNNGNYTYNLMSPGNSSIFSLNDARLSRGFPLIFPAVNLSIFSDMVNRDMNLTLNGESGVNGNYINSTVYFYGDGAVLKSISQTTYDFNGKNVKAFKAVFDYNYSAGGKINASADAFLTRENYTFYVSAVSGIVMDMHQSSLIASTFENLTVVDHLNQTMVLQSTNVRTATAFTSLSIDMLIVFTVLVVVATVGILAFLYNRKRKASTTNK